jgi:tetratricopeptide (TPR) repeat protein
VIWRVAIGASLLVSAAVCVVSAQVTVQSSQPSEPIAAPEESSAQASLEVSEAELRRDLEHNPQSTAALYQLGLVLRLEDKPAESLTTYTRAASQQKPNAEQLWSVALDYVLLNDYNDAIHWLETAHSRSYVQPGAVFLYPGRIP